MRRTILTSLPLHHVVERVVLACAVMLPVLMHVENAARSESVPLENDQIDIEYVKPNSGYLVPTYQLMKQQQVLEQLKQILSPLVLPAKMKITMHECGYTNAYWMRRHYVLNLCYELLDWTERLAPKDKAPEGYTHDDFIIGNFLYVAFHELGHGMFDIYGIPIFGREEDAADQMAGFILSQFGPEVTRRTLPAAAYEWQKIYELNGEWPRSTFSDVHGHPLQRSYNLFCMAYGSDQVTFKEYVDSGLLPPERAANCKREYDQLLNAFTKTVLPHIDRVKMNEVRSRIWLPTDGATNESSRRVRHRP